MLFMKKKRNNLYGVDPNNKPNWFAWRPVRLEDGRIAWLCKVFCYFDTWYVWGGWSYLLND